MIGTIQNDAYYKRMASSLGDKSRMLAYVEGHQVLDIGAGGGELSLALANLDYEVTALDAFPHPTVDNHPRLTWVKGWADDIEQYGRWDTVIACSVFHEVYSYGRNCRGDMDALKRTIQAVYNSLPYEGMFIVRDGVKPTDNNTTATLTFTKDDGELFNNKGMERFLLECPFSAQSPLHEAYMPAIDIIQTGEYQWTGTPASIMEALFTLTWGKQGFAREVQELFGIFTLTEYKMFIESFGFKCIYLEEYVQPGYPEHTNLYTQLDGFSKIYPATNALWVFKKI